MSMQPRVLEANLQCCESCPKKVKANLQKIRGVSAVDIDARRRLISVHGMVEPSTLIQTLEKIGIKAKLLANNDTVPRKQQEKCLQTCSCDSNKKRDCNTGQKEPCLDVSDSDDDDSCSEASVDLHPPEFGGLPRHNLGPPPLPAHHYASPMMWPGQPLPFSYGYNLGPPPYQMMPPPMPYPYSFYEKRRPAPHNTMLHTFSDENVNACSIM